MALIFTLLLPNRQIVISLSLIQKRILENYNDDVQYRINKLRELAEEAKNDFIK